MRALPLPRKFPEPQSMGQSPVPTWIRWIREESKIIISDLDEEIKRRNDPDDPFNGTASSIFNPLEHDTREPLILLPEHKKHSQCKQKMENSRLSPLKTNINDEASTSTLKTQLQKMTNGKNDYSTDSLQGR